MTDALVGRDGLLRELAAAAGDARGGAGSVIVLTGEAGIGKTSVARALVRQVRDDLAVSWGTCIVDGSAPPFWPWHALVDPDPSGSSPDRGGQPTDPAVGAPRFERLNALRGQVLALARAAPRLHVIEDLQWADVSSVLLLAHVAAAIVDAPMLVLATFRTGEPSSPQLDDAVEEVRRLARVREMQPLSSDDIALLLRDGGADLDPGLSALVRDRSGGNPLFVTELLRAAPSGEGPEHRREVLTRSVPSRVSELVSARLSRLPAMVVDALGAASVLGSEGDARVLALASGHTVASMSELLDQARAARILDAAAPGRWRFRHQLIRDAVYNGVSGSARARLHAAVLEVLAADSSTPPAVLAHHALSAQPLVDADRALALATAAGDVALGHHAYEEAVTWFERALAAAPVESPPRWRAELLVRTGEALRHIGEIDAARAAFVDAADLADDPGVLARAALGYADPGADLGIAYRTDDTTTGALLDRALAAQPPGDSLASVRLEARLAAVLYFSDDPARSRALAESALAHAERLEDTRSLGIAGTVVHDAFVVGQAPLDRQLAGSVQLLQWARETGSTAALLAAHRARVFDLLAAGDIEEMDAAIVAFRRVAEPLRAPGYLWWPALWSAMRVLLEGRLDIAEERAMAAFQIGAKPFPSLAFANLSFFLFFLRREQGRLEEMEHATREFAATRADIPALRVALAFLLAETGQVDEAGGMLAATDERALARLQDRNWPASWFQLARAAHVVGDRALALRLLDPARVPSERCVTVSLATVCLGAADLATAWLHHTAGDLHAADEHYALAEEVNARIGARSWLAHARADRARLRLLSAEPSRGSAAPAATAVFRRVGAVWELDYGGRAVRLPHTRGLTDIAHLIARPDQAVSVIELSNEPGTDHAGARGAPALDEQARREIGARLRELDAEEADAEASGDGERAALARERRQELAEAVARDVGLGGRSRRVGDPIERARKTVSTRIRRAIAAVAGVHPELGRHLERSIDTGTWCAYRPAERVTWRT